MVLQTVIVSQYLAALRMLRQAIERCPDDVWDDPADANRYWHIVYHVLFYTHLYLQPREADFKPWRGHRAGLNRFEARTPLTAPSSPTDLLAYWEHCAQQVVDRTAQLDPNAPSGFDWLPIGKLELQFYNIRHIQQHTGELMERLGARAGIGIDWVGQGQA